MSHFVVPAKAGTSTGWVKIIASAGMKAGFDDTPWGAAGLPAKSGVGLTWQQRNTKPGHRMTGLAKRPIPARKGGGSARESNPPTPLFTRHNGFEVRKSHRAPSTPLIPFPSG